MKIFLTCPNCGQSDFERIKGEVKFRCKNCGSHWLAEDMIGEAEDAKQEPKTTKTYDIIFEKSFVTSNWVEADSVEEAVKKAESYFSTLGDPNDLIDVKLTIKDKDDYETYYEDDNYRNGQF